MSMRKDPVCGMSGVIERHGHWFCSDHCIQMFERQQAQAAPGASETATCHVHPRPWYRDAWIWVPCSGIIAATLGWWWNAAGPVSDIYRSYLQRMAIPLLAGLLLGGIIDYFIPKTYIVKLLAGQRKRIIGRAVLLGFLASSCSHGCLALTLELYRKGASIPAVIGFLLASPWASMSLTFIMLGLFGLKGLAIMFGALLIALITGLVFQRLDRRGLLESNPHAVDVPTGFSIRADMLARWRAYAWTPRQLVQDLRGILGGMVPLGRMILGWVQLGLILSAVFGALIPHGIFERWLGPSIGGLLVTLMVATIMEVCSEGTAPIAFELYRNTGALGNAFAFLMGGVVTDYTELGALWTNIGRRTVMWLVAITLPLVLVFGWLLNLLSAH